MTSFVPNDAAAWLYCTSMIHQVDSKMASMGSLYFCKHLMFHLQTSRSRRGQSVSYAIHQSLTYLSGFCRWPNRYGAPRTQTGIIHCRTRKRCASTFEDWLEQRDIRVHCMNSKKNERFIVRLGYEFCRSKSGRDHRHCHGRDADSLTGLSSCGRPSAIHQSWLQSKRISTTTNWF